jgi:LPXTG-motif cell wall-anchored protein
VIPRTGAETGGLLLAATMFVAAGLALWGVGRRRRTDEQPVS